MSNEILSDLLLEYDQKKRKAELDLEKRKQELYEKVPRLQEIEDSLNTFAITTTKNILNGNTTSFNELTSKVENLKKEKEKIEINFLDGLNIKNEKQFINWMESRNRNLKDRNMYEALEGILNYKLVKVLLNLSEIKPYQNWSELSENQKNELAKNITKFSINILGTNSFDKAQVCTGGIPLDEIDTKTMQSKKENGLYITGEMIDVDGDCGGYNLEWAWTTGMIAGNSIS